MLAEVVVDGFGAAPFVVIVRKAFKETGTVIYLFGVVFVADVNSINLLFAISVPVGMRLVLVPGLLVDDFDWLDDVSKLVGESVFPIGRLLAGIIVNDPQFIAGGGVERVIEPGFAD